MKPNNRDPGRIAVHSSNRENRWVSEHKIHENLFESLVWETNHFGAVINQLQGNDDRLWVCYDYGEQGHQPLDSFHLANQLPWLCFPRPGAIIYKSLSLFLPERCGNLFSMPEACCSCRPSTSSNTVAKVTVQAEMITTDKEAVLHLVSPGI